MKFTLSNNAWALMCTDLSSNALKLLFSLFPNPRYPIRLKGSVDNLASVCCVMVLDAYAESSIRDAILNLCERNCICFMLTKLLNCRIIVCGKSQNLSDSHPLLSCDFLSSSVAGCPSSSPEY